MGEEEDVCVYRHRRDGGSRHSRINNLFHCAWHTVAAPMLKIKHFFVGLA